MTHNFSQTSVGELRKILVASGMFTKEQADEIKGKAKLVEEVMKLQSMDNMTTVPDEEFEKVFNSAVVEEEQVSEMISDTPSYDSHEWNDYAMSQFQDVELQDGKYPKVDGLRRVAQLLLGEIIFSGPVNINPPTKHDHPDRATVVYQVTFNTGTGEKTFSSVAGSWLGNTDDEYAVFPEAIAEVRAEARALRRALRLRVVSAEEITKKDTKEVVRQSEERASDGEWKEDGRISANQVLFIKKACERLEIDLAKFLQLGEKKYSDIAEVPKAVATEMITRLNQYQNASDKDIIIPEEIKCSC